MAEKIKAGVLCPLRVVDGGLEVLVVRRGLWHLEKERPRTYPGEIMFAGGWHDSTDAHQLDTARREAAEELGYEGEVANVRRLRRVTFTSYGRTYTIRYYAVSIDPNGVDESGFSGDLAGEIKDVTAEVMSYAWMPPSQAIDVILSDSFTDRQHAAFERLGLGDETRYGMFAAKERKIPQEVVATLKEIVANEGMLKKIYYKK